VLILASFPDYQAFDGSDDWHSTVEEVAAECLPLKI